MKDLEFKSSSPEYTRRIGFAIGVSIKPGDIILLSGDLGTGKTCLTQGIANGMGVSDYVRSPTFVLVTIHQGSMPLYHMDLYRIEGVPEAIGLGIDEYLYGDGVSVIEWADKAIDVFPRPYILINLYHKSKRSRLIQFHPFGERYETLVSDVHQLIEGKLA
jgi:tRNA threonylcarbamoyladenosine biosynthesis protein TsaE